MPFRWVSLRGCPPLFLPPPRLSCPFLLPSLRRAGLLARAELGKTPPPPAISRAAAAALSREANAVSPVEDEGNPASPCAAPSGEESGGKGGFPAPSFLSLPSRLSLPRRDGFLGGREGRGRTNAPLPRTPYCKNKERLSLGNGVNLGCSKSSPNRHQRPKKKLPGIVPQFWGSGSRSDSFPPSPDEEVWRCPETPRKSAGRAAREGRRRSGGLRGGGGGVRGAHALLAFSSAPPRFRGARFAGAPPAKGALRAGGYGEGVVGHGNSPPPAPQAAVAASRLGNRSPRLKGRELKVPRGASPRSAVPSAGKLGRGSP